MRYRAFNFDKTRQFFTYADTTLQAMRHFSKFDPKDKVDSSQVEENPVDPNEKECESCGVKIATMTRHFIPVCDSCAKEFDVDEFWTD